MPTKRGGKPNHSGIDWSDPAARAEYRRNWVNKGTNLGRPRGSGSAPIVRVTEQHPYGSTGAAQVQIGRALWQTMGEPSHIAIWRMGVSVFLRSSKDGYAVVGHKQDSMPRVRVGEERLAEIGLLAGTYQASVTGDRCIVDLRSFVPTEPEPEMVLRKPAPEVD